MKRGHKPSKGAVSAKDLAKYQAYYYDDQTKEKVIYLTQEILSQRCDSAFTYHFVIKRAGIGRGADVSGKAGIPVHAD